MDGNITMEMVKATTVDKIATTLENVTTITTTTTTIDRSISGLRLYVIIAKCCLSLVILFAYSMIFYILIRYIKYKNAVHLTMGYLAVADMLLSVTPWVEVFMRLTEGQTWLMGTCVFTAWWAAVSVHWQFQAVTLIAVEKYFLISKQQFHQRYFTPSEFKFVLMASFVFVMVTITVHIFVGVVVPRYGKCYGVMVCDKAFLCHLTLFIYLIYTLILVFSYVKILIFLWKKRMGITVGSLCQNLNHFQKEKKTQL